MPLAVTPEGPFTPPPPEGPLVEATLAESLPAPVGSLLIGLEVNVRTLTRGDIEALRDCCAIVLSNELVVLWAFDTEESDGTEVAIEVKAAVAAATVVAASASAD